MFSSRRVAATGGERGLVEPVVLDATLWAVAPAVGQVEQHHAIRDSQRVGLAKERVDARPVRARVAARPEDLQPPRVVTELAQAEQVLQRDPEHAAPRGILRHERRTDEDGSAHGSGTFVVESAGGVEPRMRTRGLERAAHVA